MTSCLATVRLPGVLVVALALAACGVARVPVSSTKPPADRSAVLAITVHNDQLSEARMWLLVDGQRFRLGAVRANRAETFYYPMPGIRAVRLEFDLTLGARCITTDASLGPGDNVEVRIPSQLVAFPGLCRGR
jgi:hypothetical protein